MYQFLTNSLLYAIVILGIAGQVQGALFAPPALLHDHAAMIAGQLPHSIPDLCATPTTSSTGSGDWSDSGIWDNGVPTTGDVVEVATGHTVTYDVNETDVLFCVGVHGLLTFETSSSTKLVTGTLYVYDDGSLVVGTTGAPITSTAEIVFDGSIDTDDDPEQWTVGLLGFGHVEMHGQTKTPFRRLAAEVNDGTDALTLASSVSNWANGDEVVVPESRKRSTLANNVYGVNFGTLQTERRDIDSVSGTSVSVDSNWTYDHIGGRNAADSIAIYPHVVNLTRNIKLYSANPSGTRGHVMFTAEAFVDVRYVEFRDLGRTLITDINCTLRTTGAQQGGAAPCIMGTGAVTHIGTNQSGRYAVHFHHHRGPENIPDTGYQGRLIGSSVVDSKKWPIAIHRSSYLLIQDNVVAYGDGAGVMMEEGTEFFNLVDGNFVTGMMGSHSPREQQGREGSGFWSIGFGNSFTNNVAAGIGNTWQEIVTSVGFKFLCPANSNATNQCEITSLAYKPNFRGADISQSGERTLIEPLDQPIIEFDGNEAYGALAAFLTVWHLNNDSDNCQSGSTSTFSNSTVWNVFEQAIFWYPVCGILVDGLTNYSPPAERAILYGIESGDYLVGNATYTNLTLQNVEICVSLGASSTGTRIVSNSTLHCEIGISDPLMVTPGTGVNPPGSRNVTITNVVSNATGLTGGRFQEGGSLEKKNGFDHIAIDKWWVPEGIVPRWEDHTHTTTVQQYQGGSQSFDLYFQEQIAENVAGGLAPCSDQSSFPEIIGVTCNITSSSGTIRLRMRCCETRLREAPDIDDRRRNSRRAVR